MRRHRRWQPRSRIISRIFVSFSITFICGFSISVLCSLCILRMLVLKQVRHGCNYTVTSPSHGPYSTLIIDTTNNNDGNPVITDRRLILFAVLTTCHHLLTRATTIHNTWGNSVKLSASTTLIFFTGNGIRTNVNFTVIRLSSVDDYQYPPQRKSFLALKYIYEHFRNDFHWFMRADDDVYVHVGRLVNFLWKLDSSHDILLGHAGHGRFEDRGQLGVDNNYCIGGPGIVLTQSVLRKVGPYLIFCLQNTVSDHEDTELGRCIHKYTEVTCPWADEMRDKFLQIYVNAETILLDSLDNNPVFKTALTIHPVKKASHMFRLYVVFAMESIIALESQATRVKMIKNRTEELLSSNDTVAFLEKHRYPGRKTRIWEYFTRKDLYSVDGSTVQWVSGNLGVCIKNVIKGAVKQVNMKATSKLTDTEMFRKLSLGHIHTSPTSGLLFSLRFKTLLKDVHSTGRKVPRYSHHVIDMRSNFGPLITRVIDTNQKKQSLIYFILPLAARLQTFEKFLQYFQTAFLSKGAAICLIVVYFIDVAPADLHKGLVDALKDRLDSFFFRWYEMKGQFSRAKALDFGLKHCEKDALVCFTDVDFIFKPEFYDHCTTHAIQAKQVYFPKVFSQYNPRVIFPPNTRAFDKQAGKWRDYGFGAVCVYASDVKAVGGLNTTIRGWGLEDIDFYEKCLASNLTVFRAADTAVTHAYHAHNKCDDLPTAEQVLMCRNSKLNSLAAVESLVDYMFFKGYL